MARAFLAKRDVYLEIAERYKEYIRLGVLKNGERLPSVRTAAVELGVNPNTIARAFALLEEEGYVYSLPKKGIYVSFGGDREDDAEVKASLSAMRRAGISKQALINLIEEVYDDHD